MGCLSTVYFGPHKRGLSLDSQAEKMFTSDKLMRAHLHTNTSVALGLCELSLQISASQSSCGGSYHPHVVRKGHEGHSAVL